MTRLSAVFLAILGLASTSLAQDDGIVFSLELNALQASETGCRVTFVATNGLAGSIEKTTLEIALFGADGGIERLVSLDFKGLSEGKTKVLQFELQNLDCTALTRVLVNDVTACEGTGISVGDCLANLSTRTRLDLPFGV